MKFQTALDREKEIELISELVDQQAPQQKLPEPLIRVPGQIVTPDRDARYRTPSEIMSEVMERLAQRVAFAKSLPTTLVIVAATTASGRPARSPPAPIASSSGCRDDGAEALVVELAFVWRLGEEIAGSRAKSLEVYWETLQNLPLRCEFLVHSLLEAFFRIR